ncbi:hypothetical protein [Rhizobium terrae]|uniref:hypothetical protein n=1 Tax=Rhizobium terrae TaxID=2171756 RepID=UPI0013C2FBB9|nr:hypothetical protein [Rhizobium terrae]
MLQAKLFIICNQASMQTDARVEGSIPFKSDELVQDQMKIRRRRACVRNYHFARSALGRAELLSTQAAPTGLPSEGSLLGGRC